MVRRHSLAVVLTTAALTLCSCPGKASAAAGPMGSFDAATLGDAHQRTVSPADKARRIKEQAAALHRAGEFEEASREFARAAGVLEAAGGALVAPGALSAIRCSLAAAQLKSGDLRAAEATCSQLLKTTGLARVLRQKASYRRAMARKRQVEEAGAGEAGSGLAGKAYRDAYVSLKLSQGGEGAGPAEGDAKAVRLVAEMETDQWGTGRLTGADRAAAQSKADKHLAALAEAAASRDAANPGGMFDMLKAAGGGGDGGGFGGLGGLGGGSGGMDGMPGLMDMMGAGGGGGGADGMGGLMKMLMSGAGGAGGAGGGEDGAGPDKEQMLKMAKKMSKVVKKQLRNPGTQQFVCSFLKQAEPDTIKSMAGAAGVPVSEEIVAKVSTYLKEADGKTLESWISFGEISSGIYRRLSQLAVLWSRGSALAGVWLIWVWLRACFAPIALAGAKA